MPLPILACTRPLKCFMLLDCTSASILHSHCSWKQYRTVSQRNLRFSRTVTPEKDVKRTVHGRRWAGKWFVSGICYDNSSLLAMSINHEPAMNVCPFLSPQCNVCWIVFIPLVSFATIVFSMSLGTDISAWRQTWAVQWMFGPVFGFLIHFLWLLQYTQSCLTSTGLWPQLHHTTEEIGFVRARGKRRNKCPLHDGDARWATHVVAFTWDLAIKNFMCRRIELTTEKRKRERTG